MAQISNEPDIGQQEPSPSLSRTGLYHCKAGQETVHDIVAKTTELFNLLKTNNAPLQRSQESETKKAKIRDILSAIQYKFDTLHRHYQQVNDISSSLAYVQIKSLIPFKDDPDNVEQIKKHRRNLYAEPNPDVAQQRETLKTQIAEKDELLRKITNDLRDFIYEINTMLHEGKN